MRLIYIEMKKYLITKWSLISLVLVAVIFVVTMYSQFNPDSSITYLVEMFIGLSHAKKLFIVAITIPLARLYVDDVNHRHLVYVLNRTSILKYVSSKMLMSFLGAFVLSLGAFVVVMCLLLLMRIPMLTNIDQIRLIQEGFYPELIEAGRTLFVVFTYAWNYSLSVAFWNTTGLLFSSYIPNNFIPYISPFVISYYVETFSLQLPTGVNIYKLGRSHQVFHEQSIWLNQLYITAVFLVLTSLVGYLFYRQVRRKVPYA
ncbi:hypothetical protein ACTQ5J_12100 [Fundicoccus sp. Sow4_F4]|uniref:hypothetical protein n=1 Tax=Fundicoccus sp. Sow4_F4 TaxID=3438783 RepID=UPI003F924399